MSAHTITITINIGTYRIRWCCSLLLIRIDQRWLQSRCWYSSILFICYHLWPSPHLSNGELLHHLSVVVVVDAECAYDFYLSNWTTHISGRNQWPPHFEMTMPIYWIRIWIKKCSRNALTLNKRQSDGTMHSIKQIYHSKWTAWKSMVHKAYAIYRSHRTFYCRRNRLVGIPTHFAFLANAR